MPSTKAASAGKLVLVIGPSGVGKSVVLRKLRETHPELHFPRSATTRPRRPGEGEELYRFVTDEEFDRLLDDQAFIETAIVHGGARYGTLKEEIFPHIEQGRTVVREVDVQGFESIRRDPLFSGDNPPYFLQSIFILPESTGQLIDRIRQRAPISDEELDRRIESMEKELAYANECTVSVINADGKLDETIREVERVILS